jgi:TPR repeat protein
VARVPAGGEALTRQEIGNLGRDGAETELRQIALTGHPGAQAELGRLLAERNLHEEALYWLKAAAAQKDWDGLWGLARFYEEEALPWLIPLAEQNEPYAMRLLANAHESLSDLSQAVAWWRRAAIVGDGEVKVVLGDKLLRGELGEADPAEALRWYIAATNQRYKYAYMRVAELYASARGARRDVAKAYAYAAAATQILDSSDGKLGAEQLQAELATQLSAVELEAAKRHAAEMLEPIR